MSDFERTDGGTIFVGPGGETNTVTQPGRGRVVVRVRDASGGPLGHVTVSASSGASSQTDFRGRAVLDLPTGTATISATPPALPRGPGVLSSPPPRFAAASDQVEVNAGQTRLLVLIPEVRFQPRHRFQWQNIHLRNTIFSGRGGSDTGGGTNDFYRSRPRNLRLADTIYLLGKLKTAADAGRLERGSLGYVNPDAQHRRTVSSELAELEALNHTQLMERLFTLFDSDTSDLFPDWFRYLCIHVTGLRYTSGASGAPRAAHKSYVSPKAYISRFREVEAEGESQVSGDELSELWQEIRSYLPDATDTSSAARRRRARDLRPLLRIIAAQKLHLHSDRRRNPSMQNARAQRVLARFNDPNYSGSDRPELIERVLMALGRLWSLDLNNAQALGILRARLATRRPDHGPLWKRIISRTRLRNDIVSDDWEEWSADFGRWAHVGNLRGSDQSTWRTRAEADLHMVASSLVCNEVVAHGLHCRDLHFRRNIPREAAQTGAGRPVRAAAPAAATAGEQVAPQASGGGSSRFRLFRVRPGDLANIEPGTLLFKLGWKSFDYRLHHAVGAGHACPLSLARTIEDFRLWARPGPNSRGRRPPDRGATLAHGAPYSRGSVHTITPDQLSRVNGQFALLLNEWDTTRTDRGGEVHTTHHRQEVFVRTGDGSKYDQYLAVTHVALILRGCHDGLITFETSPRTGTSLRSASYVVNRCEVVVGRPNGTASARRELTRFPHLPRPGSGGQQRQARGMLHRSVYDDG